MMRMVYLMILYLLIIIIIAIPDDDRFGLPCVYNNKNYTLTRKSINIHVAIILIFTELFDERH